MAAPPARGAAVELLVARREALVLGLELGDVRVPRGLVGPERDLDGGRARRRAASSRRAGDPDDGREREEGVGHATPRLFADLGTWAAASLGRSCHVFAVLPVVLPLQIHGRPRRHVL